MIKLELNNTIYELPTDFSEITLSKYMKIIDIKKDKPIDYITKVISILTDIEYKEVLNIDIEHIKIITKSIDFLFDKQKHLLKEQIKIDGKWYGFNKKLNSITFGEYIDLETFSSKEMVNNNIHILMAILYRPIKKKKNTKIDNLIKNYIYNKNNYEIEKYDTDDLLKRAELFKEKMKIDVVLGAMFFFIILKLILIENTKQSLTQKQMIKKVKELMIQYKINLNETGDF